MTQIAVIGLGYVGLPLAIEFGKHFTTIGYDISEAKINYYKSHIDPSGELESHEFVASLGFQPTTEISEIRDADYIIIAMPTPVDENNVPDFDCLIQASRIVGANMKEGATVIYESTVYPGATEEICIPVLEEYSIMKWKEDFNVGYSPERISPGDKVRPLVKLKKIVAGDTGTTLGNVSRLYQTIIQAGVYEASSIRVAEAAKVIENIQRDVNIALMNELSTIFNKLGLDTNDVIDAAASKWNFSNYRPGLVGGHCIGVDPYYLINKAASVGHGASFLNTAREVNNGMAKHIVAETLKDIPKDQHLKVAILGLTFKEDCKDMRNSKVEDLVNEYSKYAEVWIHDPLVSKKEIFDAYGDPGHSLEEIPQCDLVVVAVPHKELLALDIAAYKSLLMPHGLFVDVKGKFDRDVLAKEEIQVWRL